MSDASSEALSRRAHALVWSLTPVSILLFPITVKLLIFGEAGGESASGDTGMAAMFLAIQLHIGLAALLEAATLIWAFTNRRAYARSPVPLAWLVGARAVVLPALAVAVVVAAERWAG